MRILFLMQFPEKGWCRICGQTGFDFEELNLVMDFFYLRFREINFLNNSWLNFKFNSFRRLL